MIHFIARRLMSGAILLVVITTVAYTLLYLGGGDIARRLLGVSATQATVDLKAAELGLDRGLVEQYIGWVGNAVQGDLGRSWFTGQLVATGISSRVLVTLSIVVIAMLLSAIISAALGVLAAVRGGWLDRVLQVGATLGIAVPPFLIALALVFVFAVSIPLFRATGYVPPTTSVSGWVASITLPVVALVIGTVATVTQQVRGSVSEVLERDFVRTLRSRGLRYPRVVFINVLRTAGGAPLAVLTVQFVSLLGGAVIIEQVFALPGLGQLAIQATTNGDIPLVMGLVLVTAVMVVVVNLLIDLLQAALNPKVRLS
jgi:peptide/nickel transport system permease protein